MRATKFYKYFSLFTLVCITTLHQFVSSQKCIPDKKACHHDGHLGNCCSGFCMQSAGKPTGFCKGGSNACIEENEDCHPSGSLGLCCSGYCSKDISQEVGICAERNSTGGSRPGSGNRKSGDAYNPDGGLGASHIIAIVFGVITVTLLIIIIVVFLIRMNRKKSVLTRKEVREFLQGIPEIQRTLNNTYTHENTDAVPYNQNFEIPATNFTIDYQNVLGSGAFGLVLRGVVSGTTAVAAKTVKPGADAAQVKALLSELKVMIYIGKHPNVVNLIGASTSNLRLGTVYIFVELCSNGSLEKYLRLHREKFISQVTDSNEIRKYTNITVDTVQSDWMCTGDLLAWSTQIADAMNYLSEKKVIHADLATRNVLLTGKLVAKITDFGLSRKLYEYTNYVKTKQEPLPWRWMAIESLREFNFSTQSDVWSFGITLWEIFSLGAIPYPGLNWSVEFVDCLQLQSLRPSKPTFATNELYKLMTDCWHYDPKGRPTFHALKNNLSNMSASLKSS